MRLQVLAGILLLTQTSLVTSGDPGCDALRRDLRYPCICSRLNEDELALDCDRVVLPPGGFPLLPYAASIVSLSHRSAGYQALPTHAFATSGLGLRRLDLSGNSVRRLSSDGRPSGLPDTLQVLRLADNQLGDNINPIFSSTELHGLTQLRSLDLARNHIRAVERGLLKGCDNLEELLLDGNSLTDVPSSSLNGPRSLRILSLRNNRITSVREGSLVSQQGLRKLDLSGNRIGLVEGGALAGLSTLHHLALARNRLTKLNSDLFQGAENLEILDLSENFLYEFPTVSIKIFNRLRQLNLSSNLIERLDNTQLSTVPTLELLNLSRNNIANIAPGTFHGLRNLRYLDLSVNMLRTVEDDALEGLDQLETLSLRDNNVLLVPASALGRLPRLATLHLDYNRVAALSSGILRAVTDRVTTLGLARNVVRELPPDVFQDFKHLHSLDLSGNLLLSVESSSFNGLEATLQSLSLRGNRLSTLSPQPIPLLQLQRLDLSNNQLRELHRNSFSLMPSLLHLNLSRNPQLGAIPTALFHALSVLKVLDLSHTSMRVLSPELLVHSGALVWVSLAGNMLQDLSDSTFQNLGNLTILDLSKNHIANIRPGSFSTLTSLRRLDLSGNKLASFKGELFVVRRTNGTILEELNLNENELSYLYPSAFRVHPYLQKLTAARNKFNFFPAELIATLNHLQEVDLQGNMLKSLEEFDFGRLPLLRILRLGNNNLESISETAFHNTTQLQVIDLAGNKLERLGERTFQGLGRLKLLDLHDNLLSELPDSIFERSRLRILENIDLSGNKFETAPLRTLQRQYFYLTSVNLSRNKLKDIPADDSIMVNIKHLDLSFNPLSPLSVSNILGEPKTVRSMNLAGTGITHLNTLETPFLYHLNLSYNAITELPDKVFERPTLLEVIDLSHNSIHDLSSSLSMVWTKLKNLQSVDLSSNPITSIVQGDLDSLESLTELDISDLKDCTRLEKMAFKGLGNLAKLVAHGYPKLGYLDVTGLLHSLPSLEVLEVELKDSAVGGDQLSAAMNPRLVKLALCGQRVKSISSGALAGLKSSEVTIELRNTSLVSLPPALLIPLPRSSKVNLDITGSQLTTLTAQFLSALDDRRGDLVLIGLSTNPIYCDCGVRALRRSSLAAGIRCSGPAQLAGQQLMQIADDELTCDPSRPLVTTQVPTSTAMKTSHHTQRTTEPDIIWSLPPPTTTHKIPITMRAPNLAASGVVTNDDTLIISIVGGVVAFIAILVLAICIVRLRWTDNNPYRGGPLASPSIMAPHCNSPTCPCPKLYTMAPYGGGYAQTLPHKMATPQSTSPSPPRAPYSTLGRHPYQQPYYIPFPSDEKEHSALR